MNANAADVIKAAVIEDLRDIRDDLEQGRCYLPTDWLAEAQVEPHQLFEPERREALQSIVERLVDSVAIYEASARKGVDRLPFRSRVAVLTALRIYGAIGRRVAELGSSAWNQRVTVGKLRKLAYVAPSVAEATFGGSPSR